MTKKYNGKLKKIKVSLMYPSPFIRALETEFWRSESTNGSSFAPQTLIDNFFWILATPFSAKEVAVGFHAKIRAFTEVLFFFRNYCA